MIHGHNVHFSSVYNNLQPFQDPVTSLLFDHLGKVLGSTIKVRQYTFELYCFTCEVVMLACLFISVCLVSSQDRQSPDTTALSELKATLKNIIPKLASTGVVKLCTTSYLISCDHSTGLQWRKTTAEETLIHSSYIQTEEIETLTIEALKKVYCMLACMP